MSLFNNQWDSDLGIVGRTTVEKSSFLEAKVYENDVYQFELEETGDLNISLNPSSGDNADLELYRDSNDNGELDADDELVGSSYSAAGTEDTIDYDGAEADTYFARVEYHDGGNDNYLDYDFSLYTEESSPDTGLFDHPTDYDLGYVGRNATERSTFLEEGVYENDIYKFALEETGDLDISLHNISKGDDADLELYRDTNSNGILDGNDELIDSSNSAGDTADAIRYDDAAAGDYFTRVYYHDGGDDKIIDYDLTLFADEPTPENKYGDTQTNYDLGSIERDTIDRSTFLEEGVYEHDVYKFSFSETSDLDISLHSIETDDDADLELYRDTNDNGKLDASDEYVSGSSEFDGTDDIIDYDGAVAGTYFAHVDYYSGGHDDYIDYELSLSAEGYVNNDNRYEHQTNFDHFGSVGRTPTETTLFLEKGVYENDAYQFTLEKAGDLNISLYDLSAGDDADLDLFRDVNDNNILDGDDEYITTSSNHNELDDVIRYEDAAAGTYFANVNYYDGGNDDLIDYSLSVSVEADEITDDSTSTGEELVGNYYNNTLNGTANNDTIIGNAGNDLLSGGGGDDILTGSNPNAIDSGLGELDTITGGEGADIFVLGDSVEAYYQGNGYDDYATITDFDWYEGDTIRAHGVAEDYSISEYNGGTDIYYQSELVGYVENTTDVIIAEDFTFV